MKQFKAIIYIIIDIILVVLNVFIAFNLRFDGRTPSFYQPLILEYLPIIVIVKILVFVVSGQYKVLWRYVSIGELVRVVGATVVGNFIAASLLLFMSPSFPRSIYILCVILDLLTIGGIRLFERVVNDTNLRGSKKRKKRLIILGAGVAGVMVLKEIQRSKLLNSKVIAFIDDDPKKIGQSISGVTVVGGAEDIKETVSKYRIDEIIFAMPSLSQAEKKDYIKRASMTGVTVKAIPGIYEIIDDRVNISEFREVQIEDLLGREPINLKDEKLKNFIEDRTILITGGGGSIGSELARQIAKLHPKRLILVDVYENNVYEVQQELKRSIKDLSLTVLIDTVRDEERMEDILSTYRPDYVFHAAAHKHVPLMEESFRSAILNNVQGTYNMVKLSHKYEVKKFVMISTDKAVNPTNIMGATKRIGEKIVQAYAKCSETDFVAVRFGNVLGSNGSVIPLFKKQIAEGGPLTVTHPEINRYFMTIPEACQLVLKAGSIAGGGEIFILDMGEPVKIVDLAKDLIRLSGLQEGVDIDIVFSGLRPGEKLYEELLLDTSTAQTTVYDKIFIEKLKPVSKSLIDEQVGDLIQGAHEDDRETIVSKLKELVPSFKPDEGPHES